MVDAFGAVNYPSNNVYANFRNKYGVGPEDFGQRPYVQPYPQAICPLPENPVNPNYKQPTRWQAFLKELFTI